MDPKIIIREAKAALDRNRPEEALAIIEQSQTEHRDEILFLKGEIYFKLEQWGNALNQFSSYLELFPDDQKAQSYCQMIHNILGFFHKDLYNP